MLIVNSNMRVRWKRIPGICACDSPLGGRRLRCGAVPSVCANTGNGGSGEPALLADEGRGRRPRASAEAVAVAVLCGGGRGKRQHPREWIERGSPRANIGNERQLSVQVFARAPSERSE